MPRTSPAGSGRVSPDRYEDVTSLARDDTRIASGEPLLEAQA